MFLLHVGRVVCCPLGSWQAQIIDHNAGCVHHSSRGNRDQLPFREILVMRGSRPGFGKPPWIPADVISATASLTYDSFAMFKFRILQYQYSFSTLELVRHSG